MKNQKRLERLKQRRNNLRFGELTTAAESVGFYLDHVTGSHHIYRHPDLHDERLNLQAEHGGRAKPYQVDQLLRIVRRYNLADG